MAATANDIAKRLHVSRSTVSRVLNNRCQDFISQATRERVWKAAKELGYTVNPIAQALATGRTNVIGYWSPDIYDPFFVLMERRLQQLLRADGYIMSVRDTAWDTGNGSTTQWPIDGALVVCIGSAWLIKSSENNRLPRVPTVHIAVDQVTLDLSEPVDIVELDLPTGARAAVSHLVESGCRRIAYLLQSSMNSPEEDRYRAYTTVLREAGMKPEPIVVSDTAYRVVREELKGYVGAHGCPDGIFCTSDHIALGAYRGLRDLGMTIPDDVALVGCDGIVEAELVDTPISTVAYPIEEMCRLAWQFLHGRIQHPGIPQQHAKLKTCLTIRESSRKRLPGSSQTMEGRPGVKRGGGALSKTDA